MFGFDRASPNGPYQYYHEASFPATLMPLTSSISANYGAALTRAIIYMLTTMQHSVVIFFSDGGDRPIYGT